MSWCVYVSQGFCSSHVHHRESKSLLLSLYTWILIVAQFLFGYDKEKSSEDYYKVVENQWKMKKKRSLKKNIQIQVSGSDDGLSSSYGHFRPDMEADPQPTESTSSWSGSLQPEMGRISSKSSDGEFRPDRETLVQMRSSIEGPRRMEDEDDWMFSSSDEDFQSDMEAKDDRMLSSSNGYSRPDLEAEPQTTGLSSRNGFR